MGFRPDASILSSGNNVYSGQISNWPYRATPDGGIVVKVELTGRKREPLKLTNLGPLYAWRGLRQVSIVHRNGVMLSDLTPLQGMKLESLNLSGSKVNDLTALSSVAG